MGYRPATYIENEQAYEDAIRRRIQANKAKTNLARFEARPDAEALRAYIYDRARTSNFYQKIASGFQEWGAPSDKMIAIAERDMAESAEKREARKAERAAQDATSQHIGTVGKRVELVLTVAFQTSWEGDYGTTYVTGFRDAAGNVVIHKGSAPGIKGVEVLQQWSYSTKKMEPWEKPTWTPLAKGETYKAKATIKEHGTREGVAQTIISRPVFTRGA